MGDNDLKWKTFVKVIITPAVFTSVKNADDGHGSCLSVMLVLVSFIENMLNFNIDTVCKPFLNSYYITVTQL